MEFTLDHGMALMMAHLGLLVIFVVLGALLDISEKRASGFFVAGGVCGVVALGLLLWFIPPAVLTAGLRGLAGAASIAFAVCLFICIVGAVLHRLGQELPGNPEPSPKLRAVWDACMYSALTAGVLGTLAGANHFFRG